MLSGENTHDLVTPHSRAATVNTICCLANWAKLHPYQVNSAENFMKAPLLSQLGLIYIELFALKNKFNKILLTQPPFSVGDPLAKTIASYSLAVLLASKLYALPAVKVSIAILRKNNINIPGNLNQDPYALALVKVAVGEALTQACARIKRLVSSWRQISKDWSIYLLASKVIEGSQCLVSVPLCACLAMMQNIYQKSKGVGYWNDVDARLEWYRAKTDYKANKLRKILQGKLIDNRAAFGAFGLAYTIPEEGSVFQQGVDDSLWACCDVIG
ncbi:hypothetical protein P691DRAFT_683947 [Macrolepiota fuliginosa MF-IS2]|uniref:Uncharacterized protein n=1 Tax=Macrolepiota fuliginosa MF-IS2 TaxID=1400762 RepID=A0A9P5X130_9AGAR|nr:hypothetical protein P691DRAFT_683947 [Macrolepiota fuliginosa MF-IS2]